MNLFKNGFIQKMDAKVAPKTGKFLATFFRISTLVIAIVGVVGISVGFGAIGIDKTAVISTGTIVAVFVPWIVITIIFSLLWFYFSKWNG